MKRSEYIDWLWNLRWIRRGERETIKKVRDSEKIDQWTRDPGEVGTGALEGWMEVMVREWNELNWDYGEITGNEKV